MCARVWRACVQPQHIFIFPSIQLCRQPFNSLQFRLEPKPISCIQQICNHFWRRVLSKRFAYVYVLRVCNCVSYIPLSTSKEKKNTKKSPIALSFSHSCCRSYGSCCGSHCHLSLLCTFFIFHLLVVAHWIHLHISFFSRTVIRFGLCMADTE